MSNNQSKNKKARASSAKVNNDRIRPSSGNSNKNPTKIDFIENMYGGLYTSKRYSNKNVPTKFGYLGEDIDGSKITQSKTHKTREELVDENIQLKRQINQLKEQLSLQKGKTQQMRRKNSEYTKKLNIETQKQLYWSNGPNMVRGVKQQYEQMKLKYEEKCQAYDMMTQEYIFSQSREDRAYIDILEADNKKLIKRIKQTQQELKYSNHGTLTSAVEEGIDLYKRYKFEIQQQNQNLSQKLQTSRHELKKLRQQLDVRDKKIQYLDKLLIQRNNSQHAAWRKAKKVEKQKQDLFNQYQDYKNLKEQSTANYQSKLKRVRETLEKQAQTERIIFRNQLEEKSTRITKLQKQIAYLTTLLSYWKPLDQVNNLVSNNMLENQSLAEYDREVILEYSMGSTMIKYNVSKQQSRLPSHEEDYQTKSIVNKSRKGSADHNNRNVSDLMTKSIDITKTHHQKKKRTQITADKRNTQQGVKCRKITHSQIIDICETLKYRFIGFGIPIQKVRSFFDFNPEIQMVQSEDQEEWFRQYINMRQAISILTNDIFGLNETDALILSRYLVEDSPNDYVYSDPNNENLRSVVKSILKNVIGEYNIPRNPQKVASEAKDVMHKYQTNLDSALKVTASRGIISKKKLVQLFKGLGIELSQQIQDYFIGKIVIKSQNLNNLRYSVLFQE